MYFCVYLVSCFEGGREVEEALDLDAVPGAHVTDVVEVGGGADHLGSAVRVPGTKRRLDICILRSRAGEPEPGVFGSLEPEPLEKKTGAGDGPEPLKNLPAPQPC